MGEPNLATSHSQGAAAAAAEWGCHKTCNLGQLGYLLEATAKIVLGKSFVQLKPTPEKKVTAFRQHFLGGLPDIGDCAALHMLWSLLMDLGNTSRHAFSRCTSDSCICNNFWIGKQFKRVMKLLALQMYVMFHYLYKYMKK